MARLDDVPGMVLLNRHTGHPMLWGSDGQAHAFGTGQISVSHGWHPLREEDWIVIHDPRTATPPPAPLPRPAPVPSSEVNPFTPAMLSDLTLTLTSLLTQLKAQGVSALAAGGRETTEGWREAAVEGSCVAWIDESGGVHWAWLREGRWYNWGNPVNPPAHAKLVVERP